MVRGVKSVPKGCLETTSPEVLQPKIHGRKDPHWLSFSWSLVRDWAPHLLSQSWHSGLLVSREEETSPGHSKVVGDGWGERR
jgi:hypothetical protein